MPLRLSLVAFAIACVPFPAGATQEPPSPPQIPLVRPRAAGFAQEKLERIDGLVHQALDEAKMPGCVVAVGRSGKLVWRKAYGMRQLEPEPVPMTVETVFDMASLTKPMATATSIMILLDRGQLRLRDRVTTYIPEFGENGKDKITIQDLLTHQSGLLPDNALADYEQGPDEAWRRIWALDLRAEPRTKFIYTDVGFLTLGEVVRRVTGMDVHAFTQENLFRPLGMTDTGFLPRDTLRLRAVVTQQREGRWMQGEVHDPRAYLLGGVAGHAGLFSTVDDLAVYATMMLQAGTWDGHRVLSRAAVRTMTQKYDVPGGYYRGLGWDKRSAYSSNRGEYYTESAFGHGGFTGTAMWIDPELDLFVILLSNRVHPNGKGSVNRLAGMIGTVAAAAIDGPLVESVSPTPTREVLNGIDVLRRDDFQQLSGRKIGLITNHTGLARDGTSTLKLLAEAPDVQLKALFSPEHGIQGILDVPKIGDSKDTSTGLPIFSLYGKTRRPSQESLKGLDTLVFDIQDIGTRFYTYISTMGNAMEAAAENGLRFVVLDRANPINGIDVQGPVLDEGRESFVGFHTLAVRHGMTIGELAKLFRTEFDWQLDLEVVPVEGWRRSMYWDATGLVWVNPSPNMRSLTQALLYPGIGLLETTNVSVGRGTNTPFEVFGAPWIDARKLAQALHAENLAGVTFVPVEFKPAASKFKDEICQGIQIAITDRSTFDPLLTGITVARTLHRLHADEWKFGSYMRLLGNQSVFDLIRDEAAPRRIVSQYQPRLESFLRRRANVLMYD